MQIGTFELPLPRNIVNGIQKDTSDNDTSSFNEYARKMQNHRIRDEDDTAIWKKCKFHLSQRFSDISVFTSYSTVR